MRFFVLLPCLLPALLLSEAAHAYSCKTLTASTTMSPPNLVIQRDLPVGSEIGQQVASGSVNAFTCSNSPSPSVNYQQFGVKSYGTYVTTINNRRVFSTNIAGIGYAVGAMSTSACNGHSGWVNGTSTVDGNQNNRILCMANGLFATQPISEKALITFYKIAQATGSGTVTGRQVSSFILNNNQSSWTTPESQILINSFNVTTLACSLGNTAISVNMGTVEKRAFGGIGTWPGDNNTKNLTIPLTCNAGTRVNIQLDGNVKNAAQGVLNLNSATNSATGVGVQLLYNNSPVQFNKAFLVGTAASEGNFNIPLQARYYQTANNITVGPANSTATFTMTYQ